MDVRWFSQHYFKQCFSSDSWIILEGGHRGLNPTDVQGVGLVGAGEDQTSAGFESSQSLMTKGWLAM